MQTSEVAKGDFDLDRETFAYFLPFSTEELAILKEYIKSIKVNIYLSLDESFNDPLELHATYLFGAFSLFCQIYSIRRALTGQRCHLERKERPSY